MNKLKLIFFLVFIGFSLQTVINYQIDSFAATQTDVVNSASTNAGNYIYGIVQNDASAIGGKRQLSSTLVPLGTTTSTGTSTITVGGNQLSFTTTPSNPFPQYQLGIFYQSLSLDVSTSLGIQLNFTTYYDILNFVVSVGTPQGSTGASGPLASRSGILQIPFSSMTANPAVTSISTINQISIYITHNGDINAIFYNIAIYGAGGAVPVNSQFSGATTVVPTAVVPFDTTYSPNNAALSLCPELAQASSFLWYKIAPTNTYRVISVSTCVSTFDSVLGVFSGVSLNSLLTIGCNDDVSNDDLVAGCNPTSSFVGDVNINAGETIYIVVGGYFGSTVAVGTGNLSITLLADEGIPIDLEILIQQVAVITASIYNNALDVIDEVDATSLSLSNQIAALQTKIKTDTYQTVFTQNYLMFLADDTAVPPLNVRMPNAFGGNMDDIATAVSAIYTTLKANALAIGANGSTACNNNKFCQYFLGTADAAYTAAIGKYNQNLSNYKFKLAYSSLQKAYTSLYPTSW